MAWQDRQTFTSLGSFLSCRVMLCFRHEEQKANPHLGQPYCLVNGENLALQSVQDILVVSYTFKHLVMYLKLDHVRRNWYKIM